MGLVHFGLIHGARSSSSSDHESRNCGEGHARRIVDFRTRPSYPGRNLVGHSCTFSERRPQSPTPAEPSRRWARPMIEPQRRPGSSVVTTKLSRRLMLIAGMLVGSTCVLIPRTYAMGPALQRALNPQPLPPGLYAPGHAPLTTRALNPRPLPPGRYSPNHSGRLESRSRTPHVPLTAGWVCVAWGRVCVKAGQGTRTHPAPCEQWIYVCRKYG
jgi:hypothetical protein